MRLASSRIPPGAGTATQRAPRSALHRFGTQAPAIRPGLPSAPGRCAPAPRTLALPAWFLSVCATVLLAGCKHSNLVATTTDRTQHPEATSAREAFAQFREFMRAENYQQAYTLLSEASRSRYKWFEFNVTFRETRFGALLRYLYTEWEIAGVELSPDQIRAEIVLTHFIYPAKRRKVSLVSETSEGKPVWRMNFVLCDMIGIPESDERLLFPESWSGSDPGTGR